MHQSLFDQPLGQFLDSLASSAPTPGGGSAAALTGAIAAGLITMVCDLTIGKRQYASFEADAIAIRERAEQIRADLQALAQSDIDAFNRLSAAYRLPRDSETAVTARRIAIQHATRVATDIPLQTAAASAAILPLCAPTAAHGNKNAISDAATAVLLARAAVTSALINVEANLGALDDHRFVAETRARMVEMTANLDQMVEAVLATTRARL